MYCDRDVQDIAKSQAGFLKNIAMPLYDAFNSYLLSDAIADHCIVQLDKNHEYWQNTNQIHQTKTKDSDDKPQDLFNMISSKTKKYKRSETMKVENVSQNSL